MHVIFSHGKESGPMGVKINAMAEIVSSMGYCYHSVDYRGIDEPEERARKLLTYIGKCSEPFILVGSSMGAYVSLRAAQSSSPCGLFLLAPAVYMKGYDQTDINPGNSKVFVMHGWQDDIVPVSHAIQFAREYQTDLLLVNDDHVLRDSLARLCNELQSFIKLLTQ